MVKKDTKENLKLNKNIFDKNEIEKIYDSLNLPKDEEIDKADFLEFYFAFGSSDLDAYNTFLPTVKNAGISWKKFSKMRWKDCELKNGVLIVKKNKVSK